MAMDTTMERGLLMLSLRLLLLLMPLLPLRLMPGMDTTDTPTGPMAMDTMDTDLMAMDTTDTPTGLMPMDTMDTTGPMAIMAMAGERSKKIPVSSSGRQLVEGTMSEMNKELCGCFRFR